MLAKNNRILVFELTNKLIEISNNIWSENSLRLILTPSEFAKNQLFYVQETGFFETGSGYFVKRKNLNSFLVLLTLQGEGVLNYSGQSYKLKAGDVFFINCEKEHSYYIKGNSPWIFYWVHFNGLSSLAYYNKFIEYNRLPIIHLDGCEIKDILKSLVSINNKKSLSNEILSSLKITELLSLLTLSCQCNINDYDESNYLIDRIITYIDKHLGEKITLDMIADNFNLNKFYLHKKFKKITNIPINEYVINTRMNLAKEKLRFSNMSIKEISETTGFNNTSHFINLFRKREGLTPLQYKNKWKT